MIKEKKIAILGLGYVGLPLALSFAKKLSVIGFDINEKRLEKMRNGIDPSGELTSADFLDTDIEYTSSLDKLQEASFFIITVPTPVNEHNQPDLTYLFKASESVGHVIRKGGFVVFESTVYPGCTEEECIPIIERISGLEAGNDFKYGYSPERINPGDKKHVLTNTVKVVSGCDEKALEAIAQTYEIIIKKGVHRAPSIKVAEAAKIIENTQRDVNIALMNELSIIFNRLGINTYDVLEAASSKWNFLNFSPGLVGGHCIGVDPYYMVYKANELNYHSQIISAGRFINDSMGSYIAKKLIKILVSSNKNIKDAHILVMGMTFKENVTDIRNSKVIDIIKELKDFGVKLDVVDPYAQTDEVYQHYGFHLKKSTKRKYDAVVVAVAHDKYKKLNEEYFKKITKENAVLADIKGIYKNKINSMSYWSL